MKNAPPNSFFFLLFFVSYAHRLEKIFSFRTPAFINVLRIRNMMVAFECWCAEKASWIENGHNEESYYLSSPRKRRSKHSSAQSTWPKSKQPTHLVNRARMLSTAELRTSLFCNGYLVN